MSDELKDKLPVGFGFAACYAGLRKKQADDLALMLSETPASAAGVFTRNAVRAAPVELCEAHLKRSGGTARLIVVNAGNANCATPTMDRVARKTARAGAKLVKVPAEQVLVSSTGVIGEPLDEQKILARLPELGEAVSPEGFDAAARAIMTTDTVAKTAFAQVETKHGVVRIAGMAKGSGMIQPDMATMLAYVFTDAAIKPKLLRDMLRGAADQSFNRISVDSDTSTNDSVILLANGASGVSIGKTDRKPFQEALNTLTRELAIAIVRDGEGAKKLLTINVEGAESDKAAVRIAREIANSPLVKTALAGADPNWGRILPAAGKSGVAFNPAKVDIHLNGFLVCCRGMRADFVEAEVQATMEKPESELLFRIRGKGKGQARFWTCDFTEGYIKINAEYRT